MNDSYGHAVGGDLPICAAKALLEVPRTSAVVARLGGDAFGVLGAERHAAANLLRQRIQDQFHIVGVKASWPWRCASRNTDCCMRFNMPMPKCTKSREAANASTNRPCRIANET